MFYVKKELNKAAVDADWLSGVATGSAYFALSCSFRHPNRFIHANFFAIALPFVVWLCFALFGTISFIYKKTSPQELQTFWFVSAMAVLDISYIG